MIEPDWTILTHKSWDLEADGHGALLHHWPCRFVYYPGGHFVAHIGVKKNSNLQFFLTCSQCWIFLQMIWKGIERRVHETCSLIHISQQPIFNTSSPMVTIRFLRQQISDPMLANVSRTHCILHNTGHGTLAALGFRLQLESLKSSSSWRAHTKNNPILPRCKNHGQQLYQWYLETSLLCWGPRLWERNRTEPALFSEGPRIRSARPILFIARIHNSCLCHPLSVCKKFYHCISFPMIHFGSLFLNSVAPG